MANNPKVATATRNAAGDVITAAIGNAGLIKIYDGSQPAGPATAITTQTLLATLTCGSPFAAATSGGVITANAIASATAAASGNASWARITTSGGTAVLDVTVGTSGCDLTINSASIAASGSVSASSLTLTVFA